MRSLSVAVLGIVLAPVLLMGCGGEKPSEKADKGSPEAAAAPVAGATTKPTADDSSGAESKTDGQRQVVTFQTGDQEVSVVTDGDEIVVKSPDGKQTRLNVGKAQSIVQAIGDAANQEETAEPPSEPEASDTATESAVPSVMNIKTGEGTLTIGDSQVLEDFPLPVYEGTTVEYSSHMKPESANVEEVYQLHLTSPDAPGEVAKFYEAALKKAGLDVQRLEQKINTSEIITLIGDSASDGISASAQAQRDTDADVTRIIILWKIQH